MVIDDCRSCACAGTAPAVASPVQITSTARRRTTPDCDIDAPRSRTPSGDLWTVRSRAAVRNGRTPPFRSPPLSGSGVDLRAVTAPHGVEAAVAVGAPVGVRAEVVAQALDQRG